MATTLEQVREGEAPADVAGLYRDIRHCLRTTYVPLPFRVLAAHRGALKAVWEQLRPNVITRAFEEAAGDLRAALAKAAVELGTPLIEPVLASAGIDVDELDDVRESIDVFHYTDPKVLLCLAALHELDLGGIVGGRHLPPSLLMKVPEVDENMPPLILAAEEPGGIIGEVTHDITHAIGLPASEIEIRALSHWPGFIEAMWPELEPVLRHSGLRRVILALHEEASRLVSFLPNAIDPSRGRLGESPESRAAISRVVAVCGEPAYRLALLVSALKVALDGPEDALDSPYAVPWEEPSVDQLELS